MNASQSSNISKQGWLWLTLPIVLLLTLAAGAGVFIPDLYQQEAPILAAQLRGGDLVVLAVVIPALVVTALLARRRSLSAVMIWLGLLFFLVYCYLIFTFQVHYNNFFMAYVGLLGCSIYGLAFGVAGAGKMAGELTFGPWVPVRVVAVALMVVPVIFYFINLSEILPALLAGTVPPQVAEFQTLTYYAHVIDQSIFLPAMALGSILLWQRKPLGYVLAGGLLTMVSVMMALLLTSFVLTQQAGLRVSLEDWVIISANEVVYTGLLVWFLATVNGKNT